MKQIYEENKLDSNDIEKSSWLPLLRQMFVCSGLCSYFFIYGLFVGAPTVLVTQLRKESNSTEYTSIELVSLLSSVSSYGSLPWAIIYPLIADRFGRKIPYMILWIATMSAVLLFYFSTSIVELIISGFLQGMLASVQVTVSIMILTEYLSPQYRGIFTSFIAATFYWSIWISNAIGTFFYWKNIAIVIFVCCIYSFSTIIWPQSPYWLATKGRFEECKKISLLVKRKEQRIQKGTEKANFRTNTTLGTKERTEK